MAFARAHDLVMADHVMFVHAFSGLRNALVGNVGNVNFALADHLAALGPKLQSWCKDIGRAATPKMSGYLTSLAERQPKVALWFATVLLVYHLLPASDESGDASQDDAQSEEE